MKIGILVTGHAPDELLPRTGDYDVVFSTLLGGHGFTFQGYFVVDGDFPTGPEDADGWLLTGSKHGAYEDHDWIPPLEELIREIHAAGQPMIGICFGHQIIAQALGGKVEKFGSGWAIGPTEYDMNGKTVTLNAWHQDQVVERPKNAVVTASNDFCENAMLTYGDNIWTIQAHPEYDSDFIAGLIRYRGQGVVPDTLLENATNKLGKPIDQAAMTAQMVEFFKKARA